jgi:hypothetical protein
MFYAYLRSLRAILPSKQEERFKLNDEVALQYFKLKNKGEVNAQWETTGVGVVQQTPVGPSDPIPEETAPLSEIIQKINQLLGESLTEADKLLIEQVEKDMLDDTKLQKQALNNEISNFKYGFQDALNDKFIERMEQNEEFFQKFINDSKFSALIGEYLLKRVYKKLKGTISIKKLIDEGEGQNLEFKTTARWDVKQGIVNTNLESVILKTIAGFMNSEGGQLVIGVEDNGSIFGLEKDYEALGNANRDKFENHVTQLILSSMGKENAQYTNFLFEKVEGKDVCLITVRPSAKPVYTKVSGAEKFYVRTGNSTNEFSISEATEYIKTKWDA